MAIKMAIIGVGGMAGWHYDNVKGHVKGLEIVGGYDIREEAKKRMTADWGIKSYNSPEEIYADKSIDLVLIATPNDLHKSLSIACLEAGKHVLCEKPVTLNAKELEEVIAVAKKTGKIFTINQNRRWDKDYLTIRKILADKMLGDVYNIESRVQGSRRLFGWRAFKPNGGGLLLDWGVHLLDQILDVIPEKITSVQAHIHNVHHKEVDDAFTVLLRFENGCSVNVSITTNCYIDLPRWHVSGTDGTAVILDWEQNGHVITLADPSIQDWEDAVIYTHAGPTHTMLPRPKYTTKKEALPTVKGDWVDVYRNIVDVINGNAELIITPEQALRVMKVIDAAFESEKTGKAITEVI
ncbi:MAG: Gfo/Idh/MocA family oxidoreductase [Defluviitaleaceae bacterium]|nr:Gfo/Idh/MocA family oxidoreductase [Defluviitaleaceae bacterium]MCL2276153.1 Gfo/Idh/MocA family oxidoreductase [Defluviitaleaceae bacterium]